VLAVTDFDREHPRQALRPHHAAAPFDQRPLRGFGRRPAAAALGVRDLRLTALARVVPLYDGSVTPWEGKMHRILVLVAACAGLTGLPSAARAADTYILDPTHTFPSLDFDHMGISTWRGRFNETGGTVTLDRAARTGTVQVKVKTASIDFGLKAMDDFAAQPGWLEAARFPEMTYSGRLVFTGDAPTAVEGELTLRGVTRPLALKLNRFSCVEHPMLKREVCGADAVGELHRADFGMTQFSDGEAGRVRLMIQVEGILSPRRRGSSRP
jgi:polyisoprenoid-binding protein YceI